MLTWGGRRHAFQVNKDDEESQTAKSIEFSEQVPILEKYKKYSATPEKIVKQPTLEIVEIVEEESVHMVDSNQPEEFKEMPLEEGTYTSEVWSEMATNKLLPRETVSPLKDRWNSVQP